MRPVGVWTARLVIGLALLWAVFWLWPASAFGQESAQREVWFEGGNGRFGDERPRVSDRCQYSEGQVKLLRYDGGEFPSDCASAAGSYAGVELFVRDVVFRTGFLDYPTQAECLEWFAGARVELLDSSMRVVRVDLDVSSWVRQGGGCRFRSQVWLPTAGVLVGVFKLVAHDFGSGALADLLGEPDGEVATYDLAFMAETLAECWRSDASDRGGVFGFLQETIDSVVDVVRGVGCTLWRLLVPDGDRFMRLFYGASECSGTEGVCSQFGAFTWWLSALGPELPQAACAGPVVGVGSWLVEADAAASWRLVGDRKVLEAPGMVSEAQLRGLLDLHPLSVCEPVLLADPTTGELAVAVRGGWLWRFGEALRPLVSAMAVLGSGLGFLALLWAVPRMFRGL